MGGKGWLGRGRRKGGREAVGRVLGHAGEPSPRRGELREALGELRDTLGELRDALGELRGALGELSGALGELRGVLGQLREEENLMMMMVMGTKFPDSLYIQTPDQPPHGGH